MFLRIVYFGLHFLAAFVFLFYTLDIYTKNISIFLLGVLFLFHATMIVSLFMHAKIIFNHSKK
jgi:hypothetical protein